MLHESSFQSGNVLSETEVTSEERPRTMEPIMSYRNCSHNKLLPLLKTPKHLQFNPFVLEGYRPQMNAWDCVLSLTYLHNETINILSHAPKKCGQKWYYSESLVDITTRPNFGLPLLYAIWNLPSLLPWEDISLPILPYFHAAATVSPWLGSSIYHLFMNHFSGEDTYERLLQWDVVGVWVTQSCGGFTTVFVGILCLPWPIRLLILGVYLMFALKSLHAAVFAVGPWERRSSFAAMFIMRICVILLRLSPYGGGHPEALYHVFMQDLWSLIGAVISASLVPERWLPGKFDYAFNSHNIMHVLVVLGGVHMHWAVEKDFLWLKENKCQ